MPGKQGRRRTSPGGTIESLDVDMNPCEKYTDWITDAATGALAPSHEPELLAHAAECDACRQAYDHARQIAAFVDRGIESLVSGEPSAHFNTRLRARIAEERIAARPNWAAWAPIAAGALALAALLLVLVLRTQRTNQPSIANNSQPASVSLQPSNAPSPGVAKNHPTPLTARPLTVAKHPKSPAQPEVLVPPRPARRDNAIRRRDPLRPHRRRQTPRRRRTDQRAARNQAPRDRPPRAAPARCRLRRNPRFRPPLNQTRTSGVSCACTHTQLQRKDVTNEIGPHFACRSGGAYGLSSGPRSRHRNG